MRIVHTLNPPRELTVDDLLTIQGKMPKVLSNLPVDLVYLFGSYGGIFKGEKVTPLSDVDLAVLLAPSVSKADHLDLILELTEVFSNLFGREDIDLVDLAKAPLGLQYQVISTGRCLYARSEETRVDFETYAVKMWLDFKPLADEYQRVFFARIKEGKMFNG